MPSDVVILSRKLFEKGEAKIMQIKRSFLSFVFSLCASLGLLIGLLSGVVQSQAPTKAKIAFESNRDGDLEIYVMDADGSNQINLTNHPAWDQGPLSWSPDGRKIAFMSGRERISHIFVMDANGNNVRRITKEFPNEESPAWSPDGRKIAFASEIWDGKGWNREIYVMDANGKNPRNLTNHPAQDLNPFWFDPDFALSVSFIGKHKTTWGQLKQNIK